MSPTVFSAGERKKASKISELKETLHKETESHTAHKKSEHKAHASRTPNDYSQVLREDTTYNGIFSSFITQPKDIGFETQQENEKILMLLRQHPIVNVRWILMTIALVIMPSIILSIFPFLEFLPPQFEVFAVIGWYLFVFVFAIEGFLSWYYNIYIITDERIVDIDFYSLLYRSVSEAKLDKIEDVTSTMAGLGGTLFNYGTISVQTAAEKREFEFVHVPHPTKVTKFLNELVLEEERERIEGRVS
jgi:hypothetical protein